MDCIIPEEILLTAVQKSLKLLRDNYITNSGDTTKSFLYYILGTKRNQRYRYFEQAAAILSATKDDPRYVDVNLYFNSQRLSIPTIHITQEDETEMPDGIGQSEGFQDAILISYTGNPPKPTAYHDVFSNRYKTTYNLVITSDNTNEVTVLYTILKSCMISLHTHFNIAGLENMKTRGRAISLDPSIVPPGIYAKVLSLEFEYEFGALNFIPADIIADITAEGTAEVSD